MKTKENVAIDRTRTGWEAVTDIPCLEAGCPGLLRWAEAGYVPGYRICDGCGSHYALASENMSGGLKCVRRRRPTPGKISAMQVQRGTEALADAKFRQDWLRKNTETANEQWEKVVAGGTTSHGCCVNIPDESEHSASCLIDAIRPVEFAALIRNCWTLTNSLQNLLSGTQSRRVTRVLNATTDGNYVMVYDVGSTYGWGDGWWRVADLQNTISTGLYGATPYAAGKLTANQRKQLNVWR